jgi:hypothetical protein
MQVIITAISIPQRRFLVQNEKRKTKNEKRKTKDEPDGKKNYWEHLGFVNDVERKIPEPVLVSRPFPPLICDGKE